MKTFSTDNEALMELLASKGINLTCGEDMSIYISDEDAKKIPAIVSEFAPAATGDYSISEQKYIIVAMCDPYNARKHYHGEKVLKRDGATPIHWVFKDEYFDTEDEAKEALLKAARYDYSYEDDESIADLRESLQQENEDFDGTIDWYKGPGVYDPDQNNTLIYLEGDSSYSDDSMTYMIDKVEI